MSETRYEHRTDSVEEKIELLHQAYARGAYDIAMSLTDSIKDTLSFDRQVHGAAGEKVIEAEDFSKVETLPESWRQWVSGWAFYKTLVLNETSGLERMAEPVDILVEFNASQVQDLCREVRVARLDADQGILHEVASQLYEERRLGDTKSCRLVFLADAAANSEVHYLIFFGNTQAEMPKYTTDLQTTGEGFGLDIANNYFTAFLSKQMGQLERLAYRRGYGIVPYGAPLDLVSSGEGHGEPPNLDWGHDYVASENFQKLRVTAWENCPNYEVVKGPLCVKVRRWGFPRSGVHPLFTPSRLHMDLTYTFYAGLPYFLKETTMEAVKGFEANVLRDDEWLFWGMPFSDKVWLDSEGMLHDGEVDEAHKDNMWGTGFYRRESRDAFIALWLEHSSENFVPLHHNGDPSLSYFGRGQIWCRTPVHGKTPFDPGASLKQRNAYFAGYYPEDGGVEMIQGLRRQLVQPLVAGAGEVSEAVQSRALAAGRLGTRGLSAAGGENVALKEAVWAALRQVEDDQLMTVNSNVVDLGYIYDLRVEGDLVYILMTMPHRGRPKFNFIANPIRDRVLKVEGVRQCVVENTWEPAWNVARLTDAGRQAVGLDEAE
jgi:metal-sulfur cluster biosynthetic enzyme